MYQGEQPDRVVLHLYVNIELDMLVLRLERKVGENRVRDPRATYQHEQCDGLLKCWDALFRLLGSTDMFHAALASPGPFPDKTLHGV